MKGKKGRTRETRGWAVGEVRGDNDAVLGEPSRFSGGGWQQPSPRKSWWWQSGAISGVSAQFAYN